VQPKRRTRATLCESGYGRTWKNTHTSSAARTSQNSHGSSVGSGRDSIERIIAPSAGVALVRLVEKRERKRNGGRGGRRRRAAR
jgi:hypothetical protein